MHKPLMVSGALLPATALFLVGAACWRCEEAAANESPDADGHQHTPHPLASPHPNHEHEHGSSNP